MGIAFRREEENFTMSKKERMLEVVKKYKHLLEINLSCEFIEYYNITDSTLSTIRSCFSGDIQLEDIVCLISTSIFEDGKCGIVFTTDCIYSKSWGLFSSVYKNYYSLSFESDFGSMADFNHNGMIFIMDLLENISLEEDALALKKEDDVLEHTIGAVGIGILIMYLIKIGADLSDFIVNKDGTELNEDFLNILQDLTEEKTDEILDTVIEQMSEEQLEDFQNFVEELDT